MKKNRSVFHAVVKEQLQESLGWGLQGSDAEGLREEYHPPRSRVADDSAPLRTERDAHTRVVNDTEQASISTTNIKLEDKFPAKTTGTEESL